MALLAKNKDGYEFPVYEGELLAWSLNLYSSINEEKAGFPRMRTVVRAMIDHRPADLARELRELRKSMFNRMFGHNARRELTTIENEIASYRP